MHSGARKLFSRRWYLSNQVVHPSKFVYEASARLVSAQHPCPSYPSASSPWSQGEGGHGHGGCLRLTVPAGVWVMDSRGRADVCAMLWVHPVWVHLKFFSGLSKP